MTDHICPRCAGDNTPRNANSSYRERICAAIGEKWGEWGFIATLLDGTKTAVRPSGGQVEFSFLVGDQKSVMRLSPPEARTIANGLNSIADIVDQLNGRWSGPGHPKLDSEHKEAR